MPITYLGIGSNLGDRQGHMERALTLLPKHGVTVHRCATIIETDAVGGPPQGSYLNTVVEAQTELSPQALLSTLKQIEKDMGRTDTGRNGPRIIDLDILRYEDQVINEPGLVIPHPRMLQRDFVIRPLREIAPDLVERILHVPN